MPLTQEQKAARVIAFAMKKNLTGSDLKVIYGALNATWQAIGSDVLGPEGPQTIKRAEVIEVCLDCEHAETYGCLEPEDKAEGGAWHKFRALPYDDMIEVAKGAFKHTHYGW